ncbi:hypothetical protein VTI74DRAFT_3663 [Chaetomium olivicolor]
MESYATPRHGDVHPSPKLQSHQEVNELVTTEENTSESPSRGATHPHMMAPSRAQRRAKNLDTLRRGAESIDLTNDDTSPSPAGPGRSPELLSVSTALHTEQGQPFPVSRRERNCARDSCRLGRGCDRHTYLSEKAFREHQLWKAACSSETGDGNDCLSLARSGSGEGSLRCDKADTSDLATTESTPQPPSSRDLDNNVGDDYRPADPPVLDRGEQAEGNDERELATAELSMHSSISQDWGNRQSNSSRRWRCDTDDEQNCSCIAGGVAEQGKDDVVQPPQRKRRRVGTSVPTSEVETGYSV